MKLILSPNNKNRTGYKKRSESSPSNESWIIFVQIHNKNTTILSFTLFMLGKNDKIVSKTIIAVGITIIEPNSMKLAWFV